jgi:selenide,water dikinase
LAQVLCQLEITWNENLLVGLNTNDDAAVYKLNEDIAVVQTVDYFTPVVDDPYDFGQIAAANALSDVYAMGAVPLFALNVVCFPAAYIDVLKEVLRGGNDKMKEAGALIAGGHTIEDEEPKYGLSVTGIVHPEKVIKNSTAKPGDVLILTKPLGIGVINTAIKGEMCPSETYLLAVEVMKYLNKEASEIMKEIGVNACTDITGFGLLGHAYEMAFSSGVTIEFDKDSIPLIEGARELAQMGLIPGGCYRNKKYLKGKVCIEVEEDEVIDLMFDPQTSGGLLISVSKEKAEELYRRLNKKLKFGAFIVGRVKEKQEYDIYVR